MVADNNRKPLSDSLMTEIVTAVSAIGSYGSVEIYIQDGMVTQITSRTIKKTKVHVSGKNSVSIAQSKVSVKSEKHNSLL